MFRGEDGIKGLEFKVYGSLSSIAMEGAAVSGPAVPLWFRGELVFKAHRLVYHSTLGLRVIKQSREESDGLRVIKQSREESALSYSAAELESFCELDQFWSRCVSTRIETHLEQTLYNTRATHMAW